MTTENAAAGSAMHDRSHLHELITDISGRPGTILVDKTVALILSAIGSSANRCRVCRRNLPHR